jgi:hypothetical protein
MIFVNMLDLNNIRVLLTQSLQKREQKIWQ